jgi:tetratricopeptide (TPR) repeat protein
VTGVGQHAKLEGRVFDDKDRSVPAVRIIAAGGQAAMTDNKGHFNLGFPTSMQPGQATSIRVAKPNWVVYQPMFGNCVTQSTERNYEPLRVSIVPKRSPLTLSASRLSQVIARWTAERTKLRADVGKLKQNLDEYAFLRQYAKEYGFTLDQFRDAAERWAQVKDSDDKEERALKEYWQKNYVTAAKLAQESAQDADEELKQANKKTNEASLKVIRRYELAGNSYFAQYSFREALNAYNEIAKLFETKELSREQFIADWAEIKFLIGNAKYQLGIRVSGEEGPRLLKEALVEYQQSATFYTREQAAQSWAVTVNGLGDALVGLGERVGGAESVRYLNEALATFRSALEVTTREQLPQAWAMYQSNVGLALVRIGERAKGEESIKCLRDAVTAFRAALEVRTRERLPQDWVATQINLSAALTGLGARAEGSIKYLNDAVLALRAALEMNIREKFPYEWGMAQSNLGGALLRLGERTDSADSVKYLKDAVAASRAALEVRTREQLPQDWAATETNLGVALTSLGSRVSGAEGVKYLNEAVAALRAALEVRTREHLPQDWVITQINLSSALLTLGERAEGPEGIKYLNDAVAAVRAVLEMNTRAQSPQDWAMAQANLGSMLMRLGERADGVQSVKYLNDAVAASRAALEVRTRAELPQDWAATESNLGVMFMALAARVGGAESVKYLNEAVAALRAALEVRTREQLPQDWALTQINLALAYQQLRDWSGAEEAAANVLTLEPNNKDAYGIMSSLYHEILFKFDKAFTLSQQWLARHPEDISVQGNFAEAQFTVGRFAESGQRINALLTNPAVPPRTRTALRAIEIADLLALAQIQEVPAKVDTLIAEVARQPVEFKVLWKFDGTRHFIGQDEKLSSYRAWLGQLFDALASKDRDTMLKALQDVRAKFKP